MYEELETRTGFLRAGSCNQSDKIGNVFHLGGSDLIRSELGAYGERILGSGSDYVQSSLTLTENVTMRPKLHEKNDFGINVVGVGTKIVRYISNPAYYFQVNEDYVRNKLKVVLFPFLHKGHWMRTAEGTGGKFSFKPPIHDINAPDLYIPMMAFGTYILLAGFLLGFNGKFTPESLGVQFSTGLLCWLLQTLLLEATLHSVGGGDVPLLDMVAYAGYTFVAASVSVATRLFGDSFFGVITLWESFCMGMLLVKTMKRVLISEVQSFDRNSTKRNYILLFMAASQIPLLFWLGNVAPAGDL